MPDQFGQPTLEDILRGPQRGPMLPLSVSPPVMEQPTTMPDSSGFMGGLETISRFLQANPISFTDRAGGGFRAGGVPGVDQRVQQRDVFNAAQRQAAAERNRRNIAATEAARKLADERWAKARERAQEHQFRLKEIEAQNAGKVQPETPEQVEAKAAARARGTASVTGTPPEFDEEDLMAEAEAIESGQATLPFASKRRTALLSFMNRRGMSITPPKVRQIVAEAGQMREALRQLKEQDASLVRGEAGVDRVRAGIANVVGAATQSDKAAALYADKRESLKAAIGRLALHVGVLTQKDVDSAVKMLPDVWATREIADAKFADVENFLNAKIESAIRGYTTPGAGVIESGPSQADRTYVKSLGIGP